MKRILLTNNTKLINLNNINYDLVYTDSPYVVDHYNNAIYLDTLLDKNLGKTINNIRKKVMKLTKKLSKYFFQNIKTEVLIF